MDQMNHKHIVLSANGLLKPPTTTEEIVAWLNELVVKIDMKILMGPYAVFCDTEGNIGVTGAVVIETSHITCHAWTSIPSPFLKADIYSCKDYDIRTVLDMFDRFQPTTVDYMVIDRNTGNIVIENDIVTYQ